MNKLLILSLSVSAMVIAGCSQGNDDTSAEKSVSESEMAGVPETIEKTVQQDGNKAAVTMALLNPNRSDQDRADDEVRKAADVLQFTGIMPGMTVLEMEAGGGYYTQALSYLVGAEGKVIRQNPAAFDAFMKPEDLAARFGEDGNRFANVEHLKVNFDAFETIADDSVDVVTWFLGPHELFFTPEDGNTFGTPEKSYAEIYRVLKPGGKFIALDHKATPGAPETTGNTTHRIDPDTVKARVAEAGLVFKQASNILANSKDDYNLNVFDPSVRRKTDRFLHMYEKPE
ncbi:MAG: class I SAM-dependent methyltransferase [Hyphomonadaceae bacterium]|nr:class I SAM-dependent methyltransferase [Hyphomonadaceae bacterium]